MRRGWEMAEPSMPLVIPQQNCSHVSAIDNIQREVPIIRNLIIFLLDARDLARKYLAGHCLNLIDQGLHVKIANVG